MNKPIAIASAFLASMLVASPAAAVSPATQATANAKIYKPLTISKVQNLDFGVIVLTGASFAGAAGSSTGVDFSIGGSITLASTTPDGVYSGTFAVTADYQ